MTSAPTGSGRPGAATRPTKQEQLPAEDEATEVAPGVVRLQLPILLPGLGHVNCYLLEDGDGVALVDPGLPGPDSHRELVRRLRALGVPPERVHTVLVTHSHPDHFGGAGRLHAEHRSRIVAHEAFTTPFDPNPSPLEDDLIELEDRTMPESGSLLEEVLFGEGDLPEIPPRVTPWGGEGFRPGPDELVHMRTWDDFSKQGLLSLRPTHRVRDEQHLRLGGRGWTVVHTPGHTGDHICLFEPESGTLLSGDHVLPTITPHISGISPGPDALAQFFAALRRVARIDGVRTVLPAHGLPFHDLEGRVEDIIEHHDRRLDVLRGIADSLGEATVRDYSHQLFRERSWGPMAESETYAHLEHLRTTGEVVSRRDDDGRVLYRPS